MSLVKWLVVIASVMVLFPAFSNADAPRAISLQTLDLSLMSQGYGRPQIDRSIREQPLSIGGQKFAHGVGTHAESAVWIDLAGGSERFSAKVGVDDAAGDKRASLGFHASVDGHEVWHSGPMKLGDAAKPIDIDLHGAKTLFLYVDDGDDGNAFDHADYADAQFTVSGSAPKTTPRPSEKAEILTPPPPHQPRINGPRILGVRPGSPILYRMPVTGDRPMTYSVKDLPSALSIDSKTGFITGQLKDRGEYKLTFVASNSLGEAARPFKIVCGDTLALTPYMGWNHWYTWFDQVSDKTIRAGADSMISTGMADHGYQYVNMDDCWAVMPGSKDPERGGAPRDDQGRILPNKRFPDMKALTDYIHGKGLLAGIYTSPGPLTCARYEGAYQHEEQDAKQYVDWGFDFLKYDWCSYGRIARRPSVDDRKKPYAMMGDILKKQPRDIVYNLCQYGDGDVWKWGAEVGGNSWRTAGDLGNHYGNIGESFLSDVFDIYAREELHKYAHPGAWNDPDYLLLSVLGLGDGQMKPSPLLPNQQYTQVSLWSLLAAPFILGGDISKADDFTLGLLCNDEVLDINLDPLGKAAQRVSKDHEAEVWARDLEDGSKAAGLFNRGEGELTVSAHWKDLGLQGQQKVRDVWRQHDEGNFDNQFEVKVPPHGVKLIRLWPTTVK